MRQLNLSFEDEPYLVDDPMADEMPWYPLWSHYMALSGYYTPRNVFGSYATTEHLAARNRALKVAMHYLLKEFPEFALYVEWSKDDLEGYGDPICDEIANLCDQGLFPYGKAVPKAEVYSDVA